MSRGTAEKRLEAALMPWARHTNGAAEMSELHISAEQLARAAASWPAGKPAFTDHPYFVDGDLICYRTHDDEGVAEGLVATVESSHPETDRADAALLANAPRMYRALLGLFDEHGRLVVDADRVAAAQHAIWKASNPCTTECPPGCPDCGGADQEDGS